MMKNLITGICEITGSTLAMNLAKEGNTVINEEQQQKAETDSRDIRYRMRRGKSENRKEKTAPVMHERPTRFVYGKGKNTKGEAT